MQNQLFISLFWLLLILVLYTYVGYGVILYLMIRIKRLFHKTCIRNEGFFPPVTLLIPAYNEADVIEAKIKNCFELNYPKEKLNIFVITDGSTDQTPDIVKQFPDVKLLHWSERRGKNAAIERALQYIETDIVIFTDANTLINQDAVNNLARHFENKKIGAVAGEKRIVTDDEDAASGAGEGFYWKYESQLKKWDSELNTVVGAAGELFAIRSDLYPSVPADTIIEDFYITLRIAQQGYKVIYEPEAFAMEKPSASVKEELKRKVRIAAGGIQSIVRLNQLFNPIKYGLLSFQFFSHRVLRWTLTPLALPILFILNFYLAFQGHSVYTVLFIMQCGFYMAALLGWWFENKRVKLKVFFIPFYFCVMNYAVYAGFARYISGRQTVLWEKSERK